MHTQLAKDVTRFSIVEYNGKQWSIEPKYGNKGTMLIRPGESLLIDHKRTVTVLLTSAQLAQTYLGEKVWLNKNEEERFINTCKALYVEEGLSVALDYAISNGYPSKYCEKCASERPCTWTYNYCIACICNNIA